MPVRRFRFTVRTMIVLVALLGVFCLLGREYWEWWSRRSSVTWLYPSRVSASAGTRMELSYLPGQPVPVAITYNFKFGARKPAPGTVCRLLAEVWFEDAATGLAVDCYSFDAPLTVGARESATGSLTWDAILPGPGRYNLRQMLYSVGPSGDLQMLNGSSRVYHVVLPAHPADSKAPGEVGSP